jgi:DNA polymerase-1
MSVSNETKQDNRGEKFARYGWMCNELNLSTLPEDAPDGARNIAEWLTLEGRRSSLVEWLGHVKDDGRIHGRFTHIGAWTGNWLVGTDAEGIQLRILAHLMKSEEYIHAIVSGKKEDETDIHNVNKRALGMSHVTRDMAKTFIYAFLLGAGNDKVAEILKVSSKEAGQAVENFMESIQGLSRLKKQVIPHIAEMGWFKGLDGRRVSVPSEHKTLAGLLQNGEAVVMKHAALEWNRKAKLEGLKFKLVTWPHDEWQTEVEGTKEDAELLGSIQRQSIVDTGKKLSILCPLAGSTDIGKNWFDTH